LIDSCSQTISLNNKLFFGSSIKDAHFYQWAESVILSEAEIIECQQSDMNSMDDYCKHHDCSEGNYPNYSEDNFYEKYPGLKILENTLSYLPGSDFVETSLPSCTTLFISRSIGFYDLTAKLEVIP